MATSSDKNVEDLKAEFDTLRSDVARLTDTVKKMSGNTTAEGRERIRQAAEHSREQFRETAGAVETEIGERPFTSVAAAFGVGFILGKLLDR